MNKINDEDGIRMLITAYNKAINSGDYGSTAKLFVHDGILMPQGAPVTQGQQALKITYQNLLEHFTLQVNYVVDKIVFDGNQAWVRTHSKGVTKVLASDTEIPVDNKELFILNNLEGQWKIALYIFNNNSKN